VKNLLDIAGKAPKSEIEILKLKKIYLFGKARRGKENDALKVL
jgi:hypothetical protein